MACGIYSITNIKNDKRYIGSAVNIDARWRHHRAMLIQGTHHSLHLQASWNKYGVDAFGFEVVAICEPSELIELEQFYIDSFQSSTPKHGYNAAPRAGSRLGAKASEITRKRQSISQKASNADVARKARAVESLRVYWANGENRKAHSALVKEAQNRPEVKKRSAETMRTLWENEKYRKKMTDMAQAAWDSPEHREKVIAATRAARSAPESKAKTSKAATELWRDPEYRERVTSAVRKSKERPEVIEKHSIASRGESNPSAKLTESSVRDIWDRLNSGDSPQSIMDAYGISKAAVSSIKTRRSWKHLALPSGDRLGTDIAAEVTA